MTTFWKTMLVAVVLNSPCGHAAAKIWSPLEEDASGSINIAWEASGVPLLGINASRSLSKWSAVRYRQESYSLELLDIDSIYKNYGIVVGGLFSRDGGSTFSSKSYTLREAWSLIEKQQDVRAIVPVGYILDRGDPTLAGFLRLDGRDQATIYSAKHLDALLCINNTLVYRSLNNISPETDEADIKFKYQVPFLFHIRQPDREYWTFLSNDKYIDTTDGGERRDARDELDACRNVVQLGPLLLFPRNLGGKGTPRRTPALERERLGRPHKRVYLVSDLNGHLTVLITENPAYMADVASTIEDESFYNLRWCKDRNRDYYNRSQTCERWAVTLTSYEHAGFIYKVDASDTAEGRFVGQVDSVIGAVLIIRRNFVETD